METLFFGGGGVPRPLWFGQKLKGSLYRGSFRKGVRVPIGVPGGGVWGRVQVGGEVGGEVGFLWKMSEKGEGARRVWGGVGTGKGTGKSMRMRLSKLPFSDLPFSSSPNGAYPFRTHNLPFSLASPRKLYPP